MAEAAVGEASNCEAEAVGVGASPMEEESSFPSWPLIDFQLPPYRTHHFFKQFRAPATSNPNNFHKAVKWSPDGSCFLTCSDDNALRVFALQYESVDNEESYSASNDSYAANLSINEGESVYDYCWYPHMSTSSPDTCVFATTTRDLPIHLWDATSGQLRCTYRAYDAMDEITAAFSVAFNPAGTKIYAGYNKCLRIFDVHHPGREFKQLSTLQANKEGQTGIISSIAFSPSDSGMLATGSYDQTTAIYREDNMELLYVLHGQEGGVTHVEFSKDGNYLYTGGRKGYLVQGLFPRIYTQNWDPFVLCWDIRKSVEIVYKLYRSTETTNQRIYFDIDSIGQNLATGGQDGLVHVYNLQSGQWVSCFKAASDTVNGFSFHPFYPMAATSSGNRRYVDVDDSGDDVILKDDENCVSVWSFPSYSYPNEDGVSSANFKEPGQGN